MCLLTRVLQISEAVHLASAVLCEQLSNSSQRPAGPRPGAHWLHVGPPQPVSQVHTRTPPSTVHVPRLLQAADALHSQRTPRLKAQMYLFDSEHCMSAQRIPFQYTAPHFCEELLGSKPPQGTYVSEVVVPPLDFISSCTHVS